MYSTFSIPPQQYTSVWITEKKCDKRQDIIRLPLHSEAF